MVWRVVVVVLATNATRVNLRRREAERKGRYAFNLRRAKK
jgi:hypothetical protein